MTYPFSWPKPILSRPAALGANTPTLTDEERKAIEWFAAGDETCYGWGWKRRSKTLRGLLERLGGGETVSKIAVYPCSKGSF